MAVAWRGRNMNLAALDSSTCRFKVGVELCQPIASPGTAQSSANCNVEVLNDV